MIINNSQFSNIFVKNLIESNSTREFESVVTFTLLVIFNILYIQATEPLGLRRLEPSLNWKAGGLGRLNLVDAFERPSPTLG